MANKTTQKQRFSKLRVEMVAQRILKLQGILEKEGVSVTDAEARVLIGWIAEESEKRGWIDLEEFKTHELVDMADKLHFILSEQRRWEELLRSKGLPLPPYLPILKMRYSMGNMDWWAKTSKGWYWMRTQGMKTYEWKHAPMGPPGEY